jgi:4-amino-4-deoxy-L-arabinose transferase-like glycosyltransferase
LSKRGTSVNAITRIIFLVLLGLIALSEPILVLIFFVPIVGWLIWRDQDRISQLEKRLAALETRGQGKTALVQKDSEVNTR